MTNTRFGKLENSILTYAPIELVVEGSIHINPSDADYLACGWKEIVIVYPTEPAGEGKHWESDGWEDGETTITRKWKAVEDAAKHYSIPDLFFWLKGYDVKHVGEEKGQAVTDWLNTNNLYTIAVTTRVVSADNEYFAPTIAAIKIAVGFSDADIAEALEYAETTAEVDAVA